MPVIAARTQTRGRDGAGLQLRPRPCPMHAQHVEVCGLGCYMLEPHRPSQGACKRCSSSVAPRLQAVHAPPEHGSAFRSC